MSLVVVDASLAAAFLLREPSGKKFDPLLEEVVAGLGELHVPALFSFEIANILVMARRQRRLGKEEALNILAEWDTIPFHEAPPPTPPTKRRIIALAQKHRLTAYDAAYVELAQRLEARLISLDQDILRLRRSYQWIS